MNSVLITGGTGSFGRAFVKRILNHSEIYRIAIYSRGEHAQEEMAHELKDDRLRFFIGDVRDLDRLEMAMRGVDTVVHAAALKIVPTAEYNPTECIATNVRGAENVVKAAIRANVKRVVALSTDKAVNPINLYGASKLAAEKIFLAANALSAGQPSFNVVRYGNVSGSRGSVIPYFKKLKAEGKPLPVTDERMTRFWITMDQAIDLVLETEWMARSGLKASIVVPMIPSIRITELAQAFDTEVTPNTGIRPGEKIHETLITEDEARVTSQWSRGKHRYYVIGQYHMNLGIESLVKPGFQYSSDTNTEWLTIEQLKELI